MIERLIALIPAAGSGSRAGSATPKQYLTVAGKPILVHVVEAFARVGAIERIVVVLAPDDSRFDALRFAPEVIARIHGVRVGGATRAASVANGLAAIAATVDPRDWILVHDAARCGITPALIEGLVAALGDDEVGGLLALPVADTIKRAAPAENRVEATIARDRLWQAQTPQMFRHGALLAALLAQTPATITDEASAIEAAGGHPRLVPGAAHNFKVTTADDLAMMDAWLRSVGR